MPKTPVMIMVLSVGLFASVAWLGWTDYVHRPTVVSIQTRPTRATTDPSLYAVGDISSCDNAHDDETATLIPVDQPIALLGDTVYPKGTTKEFQTCFEPSWGHLKKQIHPAVGNHEYETGQAEPYFTYFGAAAGEPGKGYYSYDIGSWHLVVLNSNCTEVSCTANSEQVQWLKADLANHPATCTLAYYHHPRWSSGLHGSDAQLQTVWEILSDQGVDVVLNGHDHMYERFAPLDRMGHVTSTGMREFIVGTGGRSLYTFRTITTGSEVRSNDAYGVLQLVLHQNGYDWKFLSVDGRFVDQGFDQCH